MSLRAFLATTIFILALPLVLLHVAAAEVVGHFTQVEGRVDLLKGGKLPATPVKIQDGVEPGDILRTKSLSKAQVTFIDNSVITVSPESRIAIEEYQFNAAQKQRNAVLNIFQGLTHVIVNKLFKLDEPDFVVKTQTAVMGVRGTDFGVRIHPNSTTVLNFQGAVQVGNIFPEVGQLFRRAAKIAFSWGSGGHWVTLGDMQGSTVGRGMPPTLPFVITAQDQQQFMNQMSSGMLGRSGGQGTGTVTGGGGASTGGLTGGSTTGGTSGGTTGGGTDLGGNTGGIDNGIGNNTVNGLNTVTIPPEAGGGNTGGGTTGGGTTGGGTTGGGTTPTTQTYAFTQTTQSTWTSASTDGITNSITSTGWGVRTGVATAGALALPASYTGYFSDSSTGDRTVVQGSLYPAASTGVSTSTLTGTVTGVAGGTLTGTGTMTGTSSFGQTTSFTGVITIDSSGVLTFTYGGVNGTSTISSQARLASATGTTTYTPGNYFTQTLYGAMANTSSSSTTPPYSVQSTTTPSGWAGATTNTGPLAQYYAITLAGSQTSPWGFSYLGQNYDSLAGTMQGVVNPTTQQGAATITSFNQDSPFVSSLATPPSPYLFGAGANAALPIVTTINSIDPTTGVISGTVHTTDYQDGKYASGVYALTQTPQATPVAPITGDYNFTETYTGAFMLNGSSVSPGATNSSGYGYRSGTGGPGLLLQWLFQFLR